jgi:SAM-dependent methyltransferase
VTARTSTEFLPDLKEQAETYYASRAAVALLNEWYKSQKEEAFIDFILSGIDIPPDLPVVEIGGGAGVHGIQMKRHFQKRYIHTDLSLSLVESARRKGLRSGVANGLATPFRSGSVAAVLMVGTSTIIRDEDMRVAQFRECGRILAPGGVCIMVTSVLSRFMDMHRINRRDFGLLAECGLAVTSRRRWGIVPGRLWGGSVKRLLAGAERVWSSAGLGVRQIVVARKR